MTTLTTPRISALALLSCAALGLTSPAYALYSGTVLTGKEVPDWAVGNFSCSGTLITPRVVLTAGHCTSDYSYSGFYHRATGQVYYGKTATYPERYGPLGDVGLVMTDTRFGGNADVQTAPIASYQEDKWALVNGNDARTTGTPLVVYGKHSLSGDFINAARMTDSYEGAWLGSGNGYREGKKLFYRSVRKYRDTEPDRVLGRLQGTWAPYNIFNPALATLLYTNYPTGLQLLNYDIDDAILLTATQLDPRAISPISAGDSGGGIFFRKPTGDIRLVGTVSGTDAHAHLVGYWPWVVNTLVNNGLREDAIILSQKILGTRTWGDNYRIGQVGQIYVYDNPYSRKLEYFRLVNVDWASSYGYFPINQKDNEYWEYLGNTLPDREQALTQIGVWGANDRRGTPGDYYVYNNPSSQQAEYFILRRVDADGRYGDFPNNQKNNAYWGYQGTDLPTGCMGYASRVKLQSLTACIK